MTERNWSVFIEHAIRRRGRLRYRPHCYMIRRTVNEHRRLRRYPLKQQRFHRFDPAIRMETPAHDAAVEHIVYSHEAHALVMTHVRINDHSFGALPFLLPRVVERLVEAHASVHADLFQTLEIFN